jgi:hypothetical protein
MNPVPGAWKPALAVVLSGALLAASAGPAVASDLCDTAGTQGLGTFREGPLQVAVGVLPPNPQFGELRVVVRVCDAATLTAVPNAQVTLVPTSPDGRRGAPVRALSRFQGPSEYDADMTVRAPGLWRYEITVGAERGSSVVEVSLPVRERPWYGNGAALVFSIVGAALAGGVAYLYWSAKRAQRRWTDASARGPGDG